MTPDERERVNILLVDDQPSRLLSYETILADLGQNLVRAGSGVEALERLMNEPYAVILLDVSMPGMDGFETAATIRGHPRFERTPIIFVTALHTTDVDRLRGYRLGAVDYVYVPVVPEILRSKVAVLVELHGHRRELERLNRSLAEANAELARANSALRSEKTLELEALNRHLERVNADLASTNGSLEAEIAKRERLDAVLREANRRKDEFLAMLAHELRNPLAPLLYAAELLRPHTAGDPETHWCRAVIERQTLHLARLVDDLLDVSRITQGKIALKRRVVGVGEIVASSVDTARPVNEERGHVLTVELPEHEVHVEGDPVRLAQVLGNILSNAAKYTPQGGSIHLSVGRGARAEDGAPEAVIRVRDSGVGIPQPMLARIFDLFTQVDSSRDRAQGGLGIGLALVHRLVELHGGTVSATSDGVGRGSEFVVRLPALAEAPAPSAPAPPPRPLQRTEAPRRVLVVEDNVDSAKSMALLLRKLGNDVRVAHDGLAAVDAAAEFAPQIVLLDIGLPKLDGYEVARRIRARPLGRATKIIAISGWAQRSDVDRAREAGFDHHLVKPVERAVLEDLMATVPADTE